jgi:hypothetical protein
MGTDGVGARNGREAVVEVVNLERSSVASLDVACDLVAFDFNGVDRERLVVDADPGGELGQGGCGPERLKLSATKR